MSTSHVRIIGARSADYLASDINRVATAKLDKIDLSSSKFANGEIKISISDNIRGKDIYVISTGISNDWSINDYLVELLQILDACKRSEVNKITLIIPHFPYLRQDKRMCREPISASLFCGILEPYVNRVITLDGHFAQFPGLFRRTYVVNCYCINLMCSYIEKQMDLDPDKYLLISPDTGGSKRIESYANRLKMDYAVMTKKRDYTARNVVTNTTLHYEGDLTDKTAIFVDDMIDTGGTIISAVNTLMSKGVKNAFLIATHGLLSGPAIERFKACDGIIKIFVTDSVPQEYNKQQLGDKLEVIPINKYLRDLIYVIESRGSVTEFLNRQTYEYF